MRHSPLSHRMMPWIRLLDRARQTALVSIFGLFAIASSAAAVPLYLVQGPSAKVSYVLGTMHSDDPRVLDVAERLECIVGNVDVVAVEIVPDALVMAAAAAATLLPTEQRLADVVGEARWSQLQEMADKKGLPVAFVDRLKPWAAAVTLGLPTPRGTVLDDQIANMAIENGRRVIGLESAAEQIAVFDLMPLALQLEILDATIKNDNEMPKVLEAMTAAYLEGDLGQLEDTARSQYDGASAALTGWFEQSLLQARNAVMLQRALELLLEDSALIAVGALHLGGDAGLLAGFRQQGFSVGEVEMARALAAAGCGR